MSLRFLILFTFLLGICYPVTMTIVGNIFFSAKANGSLVVVDGQVRGSHLIAQQFIAPKYFYPRPSRSDYKVLPAQASNYAPTSQTLSQQIRAWSEEHPEYLKAPEMLSYSGSGLDPHIGPAAIVAQLPRVVAARNLNPLQQEQLKQKIQDLTEHSWRKILGQERINVLDLNLAMDQTGL